MVEKFIVLCPLLRTAFSLSLWYIKIMRVIEKAMLKFSGDKATWRTLEGGIRKTALRPAVHVMRSNRSPCTL